MKRNRFLLYQVFWTWFCRVISRQSLLSHCMQASSCCISVCSLIGAPKALACDLLKNKCTVLCRETRGWVYGNFWHQKFHFSVRTLEMYFYQVGKRLPRPNENHWNVTLYGRVASCVSHQMKKTLQQPESSSGIPCQRDTTFITAAF